MGDNLIKESKTIRKYIRKDGTVAEKEYTQRYAVIDKSKKITHKKLIDKVKEVKKEDFERVYQFLTEIVKGKDV
ncbi:Hypothetical protein PACV_106 [Pacmanvirus A23]|uniref:Hypothetical protein n=1 Tax=Pacmanvirus A23 TaxID=1932881 RepID=UPI000A0956E4|nr:Hypothetical protein B9W72_gp105 [Pacmanvirus A23]SIP85822.1 Hypothetical protein PACV_106 [Pacmanvirus A23]